MTVPSTSQLSMWDGTPFTNTDWDGDNNQFVSWLTSGSYDMTFGTVSATTYTGLPTETFNLTTGADITAGDVVRISGGLAIKATNANDAGVTSVVGVATETVVSGGTLAVSNKKYESFAGLTVGATYYLGVDGAITSVNPGVRALIIGVAVSATRLNVNISPKLESQEVRQTNFITKTLQISASASNKYKFIDISSGAGYFSGMLYAVARGTATETDAVYAVSGSSNDPNSSVTQISSRGSLVFGWDTNRYLYVQAASGGSFTLTVTYFITGQYNNSQLLDTASIV